MQSPTSPLLKPLLKAWYLVLDRIPTGNPAFFADAPDPGSSYTPYKVYSIGNHQLVELVIA